MIVIITMGGGNSKVENIEDGKGNYQLIPKKDKKLTYDDPFYLRVLTYNSSDYYEHDKYEFLSTLWDNAVKAYDGSEGDLRKAINYNMHKLIDDHNFMMERCYHSQLITHELVAKRYVYGYKLARVLKKWGEVHSDVAVVVTLKIDIDKAKVASSYTGKELKVHDMLNDTEYCCDMAEVYGFKVLGDIEDVMKVTPYILSEKYMVVSNFDINFKYTICHLLTEPNFGKKGTGCYQGIHFFKNEDAAVRYVSKGMLNKIARMPEISQTLIPEEQIGRKIEIKFYTIDSDQEITHYQYISDAEEALLRYYNSSDMNASYRGLKSVCRDMYGDWYVKNNFSQTVSEKPVTTHDIDIMGIGEMLPGMIPILRQRKVIKTS